MNAVLRMVVSSSTVRTGFTLPQEKEAAEEFAPPRQLRILQQQSISPGLHCPHPCMLSALPSPGGIKTSGLPLYTPKDVQAAAEEARRGQVPPEEEQLVYVPHGHAAGEVRPDGGGVGCDPRHFQRDRFQGKSTCCLRFRSFEAAVQM